MRLHYLIIPLIVVLVAASGGLLTDTGLGAWYETLNKPSFTPPGTVISSVWTLIFIMSAISALIFWNRYKPFGTLVRDRLFSAIVTVFILNALLNVFWSFLFFNQHLVFAAFIEAIVLDLSVIALIVLLWRVSIWSSILLFPYALWVAFASFLNFTIWTLNRG